jgi:glycosyltransferase involved in cell wall biosynthesis
VAQKNTNFYEDVSIIIPAYNEEEVIGNVLQRLIDMDKKWEIIVVDDGSADSTSEICRKMGITVLKNPYNIGLGGSLKRGAREARGDILVFIDSDGQHPPEKIPELLQHMDLYDMVVGCRDHTQQYYHRAMGNHILKRVAKQISGYDIPDLTTGFRVLRKQYYMRYIHLLPNGFSTATTITLAMLLDGLFVKFILLAGMKPRTSGQSQIRFVKDGWFFLKIIVRIIMMFSPMKIFVPIGILIGTIGVSMGTYDIIGFNNLQESSVLMILLSAVVFSFGIGADYLSHIRRDISMNLFKNRK